MGESENENVKKEKPQTKPLIRRRHYSGAVSSPDHEDFTQYAWRGGKYCLIGFQQFRAYYYWAYLSSPFRRL